jgi:hypothetical protein
MLSFLSGSQSIFSEGLSEKLKNSYVSSLAGTKRYLLVEDEYAVKAAFIYRFTEYIEWKDLSNNDYFSIAILGKSEITGPLQTIANTEKVKNKTMSVKEYNSMNEISACNILFLSKSSSVSLGSVLSKFSKSTLIITEREGYGKEGAHINFVVINNKIRFEVNLKAIKRDGINMSSELLKLAIIVG